MDDSVCAPAAEPDEEASLSEKASRAVHSVARAASLAAALSSRDRPSSVAPAQPRARLSANWAKAAPSRPTTAPLATPPVGTSDAPADGGERSGSPPTRSTWCE